MARRRFRSFRRVGRKMRPHWVANQFSSAFDVNTSTTVANVIISVPDYQGNNALSPTGVTLLRVVGSMAFTLARGGDNDFEIPLRWYAGLLIQDKDVPAGVSPDTTQDLIDERWLWYSGARAGYISSAGTGVGVGLTFGEFGTHIDVKQKARLRDQEVQFVIAVNTGGATGADTMILDFWAGFRALLVGDTT